MRSSITVRQKVTLCRTIRQKYRYVAQNAKLNNVHDVTNLVHILRLNMADNHQAPKLYDFYSIISDHDRLLKYLRELHLIDDTRNCNLCLKEMKLSKNYKKNDQQEWRCDGCLRVESIRLSSVFEVSPQYYYIWSKYIKLTGTCCTRFCLLFAHSMLLQLCVYLDGNCQILKIIVCFKATIMFIWNFRSLLCSILGMDFARTAQDVSPVLPKSRHTLKMMVSGLFIEFEITVYHIYGIMLNTVTVCT